LTLPFRNRTNNLAQATPVPVLSLALSNVEGTVEGEAEGPSDGRVRVAPGKIAELTELKNKKFYHSDYSALEQLTKQTYKSSSRKL
jgi:hypothetical protein